MFTPVSPDIIGKELGSDVRNAHHQVLLTKGSRISQAHLRIFRMWGIRSIQLAEDDNEQPLAASREQIEKAMVAQRKRFKYCDLAHPAMHQLYLICAKQTALATAREETP